VLLWAVPFAGRLAGSRARIAVVVVIVVGLAAYVVLSLPALVG